MSRLRNAPAQARYDNIPATVRADKQMFAMNWLTPAHVHVVEVHDFSTGIELPRYADLGFADRFEADKLVEAGVISVGGSPPVKPSEGLKSRGCPPGAIGVAQCVELFEQLRGDACIQVCGARIALAHNVGGPSAVSPVTIRQGPGANGE